MITIEQIKQNSIEHPLGGRQTRIVDEKYIMSVVGGRSGLYGDFVDTFEVALIDKTTKEFLKKPEIGLESDVSGYLSSKQVIDVVNELFRNGFQFDR